MKIYFAGSIRGGRDDRELYAHLINHLKKYGTVLTEHIADQSMTAGGETLHEKIIFDRDIAWLNNADVVIAKVSTPSLGVGYELAVSQLLAHLVGKRVLCLYRKDADKSLSAMIKGNKNLVVKEYTNKDMAIHHIDEFFRLLSGGSVIEKI